MIDSERTDLTRQQILERIRLDSNFVLATHENLDGDALGSLVAMHGLLSSLGKNAPMYISASEFPLPPEYRFFELENLIQEPPQNVSELTVIFLDCGNIDRNSAQVLRDGAHLLNIDHHHDNTHFGTVNHVVPEASCTAEIVWDLMKELQVDPTPAMADAMYVGLITDTGRFMYENTGPRAHQMAGELITQGLDVQKIYHRLYEDMPFSKLPLLALALSHVRRLDEGRLTLACLTMDDFQRTGAEESYSEGIIDHLRAVKGTKVAALIREMTAPENRGKRKVSLRAVDDDVDVSAIARAQGGGGHRRAAGFSTTLKLDELEAILSSEIKAQLPAHSREQLKAASA